MSTVKVSTVLGRVRSTGVIRHVKVSEDSCRDSMISADGFDDATARIILVICQLKHVICALASGNWNHRDHGEIVIDKENGVVKSVKKIDVITWEDICDCIYDYVPTIGKCDIKIKADRKLHPFAPPRVHVVITYDATTRAFTIINLGKAAPKSEYGKFNIDANKFFKTDSDGEIDGYSHEEDDNEAEMFFKSRSGSSFSGSDSL